MHSKMIEWKNFSSPDIGCSLNNPFPFPLNAILIRNDVNGRLSYLNLAATTWVNKSVQFLSLSPEMDKIRIADTNARRGLWSNDLKKRTP